MSGESERREFFRITDRIPLEFRPISRDEFERLEGIIRYKSTQVVDRLNEVHFLECRGEPGEETDQMHAYMETINRKLDLILEILGGSSADSGYTAVKTDVNISGAGVQFVCEARLKEGDLVELKIIIPVFPYPRITCLCEVVRADRSDDAGSLRCALKFMVINENDQDVLVNYIFLKERQYLRQKKETTS
ncbi:MAG TPA: PilZ domain-containing protein [Syntrophorhabdaceae bacterium]|nr:PilZ domain-containing protein [Syntrophorhabdaceae bacterium]HOD76290.1 PilZ domain-containing protein [Syntrophorhabdaceae bacterium]